MKRRFCAAVLRGNALVYAALVLAVAVMAAAARQTGAYSVYYNAPARKLPVYSVERSDRKISISFDCAWGADKTEALLSCMEEYGVKCTFFMTEFWVEKYPDLVAEIHAAGHDTASHSATHPYMSRMSAEDVDRELESSCRAIEKITGERVLLFRPPYGDYNDRLIEMCEKRGLFAIQWDVDSLDWKNLSAAEITERVITRVKDGSIILCHNNGEHTAEALPHILSDLQGRGYAFVPISQLIYRENYTVAPDGRQKPNENS